MFQIRIKTTSSWLSYVVQKKKIRNLEILYKEKKAIKQKCVRNQFIVVFFLIKLKTSVNLLKKKKKKKNF